MYVSHVSLLDFRSYQKLDIELEPGTTTFVGSNGQGKTNLVEAIGYTATLSSHRVSTDAALIRQGAQRAVVRTRAVRGDRASTVELEITAGRANRARINQGQIVRTRDVLGIIKTVLFAPEDLALIKGDPEVRRKFIDQLLIQLLPRAAGLLKDYDKVQRQRSALLKNMRKGLHFSPGLDVDMLDVWDERLADLGAQIIELRQHVILDLSPWVEHYYRMVSGSDTTAGVEYVGTVEAAVMDMNAESAGASSVYEDFCQALSAMRKKEIDRGSCLLGPHRDDLALSVGSLPAKGYASHGESWSLALSLRLASYEVLQGHRLDPQARDLSTFLDTGDVENSVDNQQAEESAPGLTSPQKHLVRHRIWNADSGADAEPILILDDVFAELDAQRRSCLAQLVKSVPQVLITAAVVADVPAELQSASFTVSQGQVTRDR